DVGARLRKGARGKVMPAVLARLEDLTQGRRLGRVSIPRRSRGDGDQDPVRRQKLEGMAEMVEVATSIEGRVHEDPVVGLGGRQREEVAAKHAGVGGNSLVAIPGGLGGEELSQALLDLDAGDRTAMSGLAG